MPTSISHMQCIVTDLDSLSDDDRLVMNMDKGCQHLSVIKNIMKMRTSHFHWSMKQLTPACAEPNNNWFVFIGLFLLYYALWGSMALVPEGMWAYHDTHAYDLNVYSNASQLVCSVNWFDSKGILSAHHSLFCNVLQQASHEGTG